MSRSEDSRFLGVLSRRNNGETISGANVTDGRVSFLIGIPEAEGRISVITAPTAA